jgi:hypothetical protein
LFNILNTVKTFEIIQLNLINYFFNWYSGGWSPIGSTQHCGHQWPIAPAPGDYDDGEIVGIIGRGTEVLGENLPQCLFVNHKHHMLPGRETGPPRWEANV